jgi:hypothetical protein
MNKEELLKNVIMACEENIPKGVEFAWCDVNGNSVKWLDLRTALEQSVSVAVADVLVSPQKANGMLPITEEEISDV